MKKFLSCLVLLGAFSVQAAKPVQTPEVVDYAWMTDAGFKEAKVQARARAERSVAAASEVNEQLLSPAYKTMRNRFLEIDTAKKLKAFIVELDTNYDSYPDDLKLMTAMLTPLLKFQAFTFKLYPYISKEKITHSMMLSMVQNAASFMTMNLPSAHWKAGFDFVTLPSEEDDLARFETASDLQQYLVAVVSPAYLKAARRVQALNFSSKPVVWDNKIFFGTGAFSDNLKRYQLLGEGERFAMLAGIHFSLADIRKFAAYDVQELLPAVREIAKLYGYDAVFSAVDGVSAKKIAAVYRRPTFASLFTLKAQGGAHMGTAFNHMKEGSRNLNLSWLELRDRNDNDQSFIRAAIFTPFTSVVDNQVEAMESLLSGKSYVRSDVTGEMVAVDLPGFYANPPSDLKALLPVAFNEATQLHNIPVRMKNGSDKNVLFRNYYSGRATNWNLPAYKTLLPELSRGSDVGKAVRIMNQSAAGIVPAMIVQPFMLY